MSILKSGNCVKNSQLVINFPDIIKIYKNPL